MTIEATPAVEVGGVLAEDLRRVLSLFPDAPGGMIVLSGPEHRIAMLNAACAGWLGDRDVIGATARPALAGMLPEAALAALDKVYAEGTCEIVRGAQTTVCRPGGGMRDAFLNLMLQPLRDAAGAVCGVFLHAHDVTKEKQVERELRASQEQLRAALAATQTIIDNSHDVICTLDGLGRFLQVSRQCERLWGYRPEEIVGRSCMELVHPDDRRATAEQAVQLHRGDANTFMNRYLHKDGSVVPVMWSAVWSPDHRTTFAIGRDMRDHVAAEEKLRQAQKMEMVGRLAGGIAHDFNNLLTVVIGAAESLSELLAHRPDLMPLADVALEAAQRGAELVSQLMAVSRTQPLAPQAIEGAGFLEGLLPMLKRTLGGHIDVVTAPVDGEICCLADKTQLTSAMLNLCINARDAMPEGGRLTLSARADGDMVIFSVADTGEGMSPAVRARALEPFFTTKPEGQGSGLGLAMVYGFAMQSGGRLDIASEEGEGTTVSLSLPRTTPCERASQKQRPADAPASGLRVLLVEDDALVRGQVERQLKALGCCVTACEGGHDALDWIAAGAPIDLMLTDVNMPGGLNGRQLADHARLLDPALRILFTSGHTEDPVLRTAGRDPRSGFLAKPYRRADLAAKLAELMDRAA
jgi:PAS domain S-box-containing protein